MSAVILTYAYDIESANSESIKSHSKPLTGTVWGGGAIVYLLVISAQASKRRRSFAMEFEEQHFWQWVQIDSSDLHERVVSRAVKNLLQDGGAFRDHLPLDHDFLGPDAETLVPHWLAALAGVTVHTTRLGVRRFMLTGDEGPTAEEISTDNEREALERRLLYFMKCFVRNEGRKIWVGHVLRGMILEEGMALEYSSLVTFFRECTVCSFGTQRLRAGARWESGFVDGRPCEVSRPTGCLREAVRRTLPCFASETLYECGRRPRSVRICAWPFK